MNNLKSIYYSCKEKNMKLNIEFEELVDAFEDSSVIHVYHIDTKKSELIYYNDGIGEPETVKEKLDS